MSIWKSCLERLEGELTPQQFNTWIRPLQAIEEDNNIRLLAPNRFVLDWINEKYLDRISSLLEKELDGGSWNLVVEVGSQSRPQDEEMREAGITAGDIVETIHDPLIVLTPDLRVQVVNPVFYEQFRVSPEETTGCLVYELGNGQWDIPALRTLLEDIIPASSAFDDFELEHDFPGIGRRVMLLNARKLQAGHHGELLVLADEERAVEQAHPRRFRPPRRRAPQCPPR